MTKKIAIIISGLSSPFVVLPIAGLIVIYPFSSDLLQFAKWGILYLILPIIIPILYILIGVKSGKISDVHVAVREQRGMPFFLAGVGAVLLFIVYLLLDAPIEIIALSLVMIICVVVFGLITSFWKISIHAASWVGVTVLLSMLVSSKYLWLFLFLPFVIWGRLARGRHNIYQILVAAVLVGICVYFGIHLLMNY